MHGREIEILERLETAYWWHRGRRRVVDHLVRDFVPDPAALRILDVGCGTGHNMEVLGAFGTAAGLDSAPEALEAALRRGFGGRVVQGEAEALPFPDASFDLVSALDVFEHLQDDGAGLREVLRILRPGGHLLAAVPALRFLWSEHDEALGHRRRYVASELHQKLNLAGFHVVKRTYAVSFVFPLILAFRLWRGLFPKVGQESASYVMLPAPLNTFFAWLLEVEARLMRFMSLPLGTSIFVVAQRPLRG
jgi:SAM-dependent methyltransferase